MASRRTFIRNSTLGITAAAFYPIISKGESLHRTHQAKTNDIAVGIADYTFPHFDIPQSIQMMQGLNIYYMSIKDFHFVAK